MGAALALHAAASGVELTHLILHEAPFNLDDSESSAASRRYREQLDGLVAAGNAEGAATHFMRTVGMPEEVLAEQRTQPWWPGMVAIAPTLVHDSEAMGDRQGGTVPQHLLSDVEVPGLVLYGDASPPWMLEVARQLTGGLAEARLQVLEGEAHVVRPDDPDAGARRLPHGTDRQLQVSATGVPWDDAPRGQATQNSLPSGSVITTCPSWSP